jgi:hypothetical protein
MSDTRRGGGFSDDPLQALAATGTGGCCGNPPQNTLTLPDPAASGGPCCGTAADAAAETSCCGSEAKAEAVDSGQGCCG